MQTNTLGQPIGPPVLDFESPTPPAAVEMSGRYCVLQPADPDDHAEPLWDAAQLDTEGRMWTYLSYGPFPSAADYRRWMVEKCRGDDPLFFAVVEPGSGLAVGLASFLRIEPSVGVIEVGHVQFSPRLQKTTAATEAMYLMMRRVFADLGYRRYEWKCDALNEPSRRAAGRLGFRFEGIFRQATMYKGRSRDTAWYSILDSEWPALEKRFQRWLAPENFDGDGRQLSSLAE